MNHFFAGDHRTQAAVGRLIITITEMSLLTTLSSRKKAIQYLCAQTMDRISQSSFSIYFNHITRDNEDLKIKFVSYVTYNINNRPTNICCGFKMKLSILIQYLNFNLIVQMISWYIREQLCSTHRHAEAY